jgi:hypothetical protein
MGPDNVDPDNISLATRNIRRNVAFIVIHAGIL